MNETKQVFYSLYDAVERAEHTASGIPTKYDFKDKNLQIFKIEANLYVFPESGGCLIISDDGTWSGDIAPFSD